METFQNEDVLKKCVQDYQNKLKSAEDKTVAVRHQAEEKLALYVTLLSYLMYE